MQLFNTPQTQKIDFLHPDEEIITVCVYSSATSKDTLWSHAFSCCTADILVRYLQWKGHTVTLELILKNNPAAPESLPDTLLTTLQTLNVLPPDHFYRNAHGQTADILIRAPGSADQEDLPAASFCLETAVPQTAQPTTLTTLLQSYSPDTLRVYLAQHHYRHAWAYDEVSLQKAALVVEKLKAAMNARSTGQQIINIAPMQRRFTAVMDNDLDTSKGLATLLNLADEILFRAPNELPG